MISDDRRAGPVGFNAVDTSADPGGLIQFLDAANATAGLTAAKHALLEQLDLGRARAALFETSFSRAGRASEPRVVKGILI